MSVTLNQVIPWGRSLQEYTQMFNLSDEELNLLILGVGDGPASFNGEMNTSGHTVLSIDPIYSFSGSQIRERIEENYDTPHFSSENKTLTTLSGISFQIQHIVDASALKP